MRDIRTIDIVLLRALDALLDTRSVTRAADRLALTQPAVSGMLVRLRDAFGDPLLVRSRRGMVPTPRGLALAEPVRRLLADVAALLRPDAFDPATAELTLSIAATDYALSVIVVPFLAALRARAPGIRVAVRPIVDAVVLDQLERGDIDLALMTPDTADPALHARRLFDERYVCVLRTGHPAAAAPLTPDRFCALDHALVSFAGRFAGVTDAALAERGLSRRVVLSVASFLVLPDVLRASDLVAVVPARLVADAPGLTTRAPPLPIPGFTKLAAWHDRTHRDPARAWVRALLFETCAEP